MSDFFEDFLKASIESDSEIEKEVDSNIPEEQYEQAMEQVESSEFKHIEPYYQKWLFLNGGQNGDLYKNFSENQLKYIFFTAYNQNRKNEQKENIQ